MPATPTKEGTTERPKEEGGTRVTRRSGGKRKEEEEEQRLRVVVVVVVVVVGKDHELHHSEDHFTHGGLCDEVERKCVCECVFVRERDRETERGRLLYRYSSILLRRRHEGGARHGGRAGFRVPEKTK